MLLYSHWCLGFSFIMCIKTIITHCSFSFVAFFLLFPVGNFMVSVMNLLCKTIVYANFKIACLHMKNNCLPRAWLVYQYCLFLQRELQSFWKINIYIVEHTNRKEPAFFKTFFFSFIDLFFYSNLHLYYFISIFYPFHSLVFHIFVSSDTNWKVLNRTLYFVQ